MSHVTVWRLCRQPHAIDAFSGEGSRLLGGRWSPLGVRVAYSSESRSLAALEVLANLRDSRILLARPWVMIAATIPLALIEHPARVPDSWRALPYGSATQTFGATWIQTGRSAVLRVPSTVVLGEFNYLLNPAHPEFGKIKIGQAEVFVFDERFRT